MNIAHACSNTYTNICTFRPSGALFLFSSIVMSWIVNNDIDDCCQQCMEFHVTNIKSRYKLVATSEKKKKGQFNYTEYSPFPTSDRTMMMCDMSKSANNATVGKYKL